MADRIAILDGTKLNPGDLSWDGLAAFGELTVYERTTPDAVLEHAAGCRYVFTNKTLLPAETIRQLPDLAYIGVLATGYDVVDAAEAVRRGIVVTNVPAYGTDSVAQHAAALMLELARRTVPHAEAVRDGAWSGDGEWCFSVAPITELSGRTLGIVGLGRIGRAFARIGAAMNMAILASDEHRPDAESLDALEVEFTGIDELFQRADVLSLHCPLTAETERLVDARRLALMKPEALLINTGRGPLVDSAALAAALDAGTIAGAGLDVLEAEPPPDDHPLLRAPNCLVTPHIAWYARAARQRLMDIAVANVRAFVEGRPVNTVG